MINQCCFMSAVLCKREGLRVLFHTNNIGRCFTRPIKGFQNWTKWKWLTAIQTSQLLVCAFCHQSKQKHEYFFTSAKTWAAFCALWATDPVTCPWARNRAENLLTPFKNSENYKLLRIIVTGQNKKITAQKKKKRSLPNGLQRVGVYN